MPVRLAVLQGNRQPLSGLCAQLQCAGHDVLTGCDLSVTLEPTGDRDIDLVIIDADQRQVQCVLEDVEACPSLRQAPIMLVAADIEKTEACLSWSERIGDIILLPVDPNDLKRRVNSLSRLVTMTAECRRRRDALVEFGIAPPSDLSTPSKFHELSVLIVGPFNDQQVEVLKTFEGRMTASYALSTTEAIDRLSHSLTDLILVTSAMPATGLIALLGKVKSTPEWCDLPILIIANRPSPPTIEAISPWGEIEVLAPSTHPAITYLRLRGLARQWRLRQQLRGLMADCLLAPVKDGLTGLYGHSFLHHYVDSSAIDHRRRSAPLAVAVLALEGLTQINATWGYPAGDRLLLDIAMKLAGSCRARDLVARLSGRRFALLLNNTSAREAAVICRRLTGSLEPILSRFSGDRRSEVQMSLGVSEMIDGEIASTLIDRASRQAALQNVSRAS
ncbi:MAG: diguanylate cyclase [Alphaproteobacteria bacterium]|nr:diguanylate cyclase [Alphaproteobacteria bacterium]